MLGRNDGCTAVGVAEPHAVVEAAAESVITVDSGLEVYKTLENGLVVADLSPGCEIVASWNQRVRAIVDDIL